MGELLVGVGGCHSQCETQNQGFPVCQSQNQRFPLESRFQPRAVLLPHQLPRDLENGLKGLVWSLDFLTILDISDILEDLCSPWVTLPYSRKKKELEAANDCSRSKSSNIQFERVTSNMSASNKQHTQWRMLDCCVQEYVWFVRSWDNEENAFHFQTWRLEGMIVWTTFWHYSVGLHFWC